MEDLHRSARISYGLEAYYVAEVYSTILLRGNPTFYYDIYYGSNRLPVPVDLHLLCVYMSTESVHCRHVITHVIVYT